MFNRVQRDSYLSSDMGHHPAGLEPFFNNRESLGMVLLEAILEIGHLLGLEGNDPVRKSYCVLDSV